MQKKEIRSGSEFSGVGAFDYAMERIAAKKGFNHERIFACDLDEYARKVYMANHGKPLYYPKDVNDRLIPEESLDIFMTSPPCQSFSSIGNRKGKDDHRGILFFNSLELIRQNQPRFFIFENVKGLTHDDGGKTFGEWIMLLGGKSVNGLPVIFPHEDSVQYHLYWKVINAKDHGIPQNRERIFLIGIRDDQDNDFRWPKDQKLRKALADVLEENVDEKYLLSDAAIKRLRNNDEGFKSIIRGLDDIACTHGARDYEKLARGMNIIGYTRSRITGKVEKRHIKDVANTIHTVTGGGGNTDQFVLHDKIIRKLTPRECFRLMDFPDEFDFSMVSNVQAYKMAGNSIVIRVLEKIIENLNL